MYKRVFKQKGSRVYRVRYRLSDGPKIYDVPLRTHIKEVAEAKARQLIEEQERELAGLAAPKIVREAAQRRFRDHVGDFVAELKARGRNRDHVRHTGDRLRRLAKDRGWNLLRDAMADGFAKWRTGQTELSAMAFSGRVFPRGIPSVKVLIKDLAACAFPLRTNAATASIFTPCGESIS